MNKKRFILMLTLGMMMGTGKTSATKGSDVKTSKPDTLLVVGVWNQPTSYETSPKKSIICVDKKAKKHEITGYVKEEAVLPYVERGDTVIVQDGVVVRNLTMERMIQEYGNGSR